jgi:diguanylate cyclase (GGDEF)-like protein/PAS domain S-box-containing protein
MCAKLSVPARNQAKAELRKSRYERMLDSSATAAICAGPDNLIVSWNAGAENLFGFTEFEVLGKPLSLIIPAKHRAAHDAGLARAVRAGEARLAGHSVEIIAQHADGREFPVDLSLSMWFEGGQPLFGALLRDVTDRHAAKRRLEHLAHCDTLTALPNRNALYAKLGSAVQRSPCSLLLLDLDGFKHVNDTLGHSVGDLLLAEVAARLGGAIPSSSYLARLGGDEFAILLPDCTDPRAMDDVAKGIIRDLQVPFVLAEQSVFVGVSIGIAMSSDEPLAVDQLISRADMALYSAKGDGGNRHAFFSGVMQTDAERRHRLSAELRSALANNEFELHYQPQISLSTGEISGVEALLRWRHPAHGLLLPSQFISLLEESIVAEEVGDWVIQRACQAAAEWKGVAGRELQVGVNLFAAQLRSGRLFNVVASALERHLLAPDQLELEITETTVLSYNSQSTRALRRLKKLGVGIAFDDFGTGFASLSLLQRYPLTRLKIDRSFVARIHRKAGDAAIVGAIIQMAKAFGLSVIAEGVESVAQEAALIRLGCDSAQGFKFGRPMSKNAVLELLLPRDRSSARAAERN